MTEGTDVICLEEFLQKSRFKLFCHAVQLENTTGSRTKLNLKTNLTLTIGRKKEWGEGGYRAKRNSLDVNIWQKTEDKEKRGKAL